MTITASLCDVGSVARVDLALVTATDLERETLLEHLVPVPGQKDVLKIPYLESTYYYGRCGLYDCIVVCCEAGSVGRDGSILVISDAIMRWNPHAVIMVGIAFGRGGEKQILGDVLVSTEVFSYDQERVGIERIPRNKPAPCGQILGNRIRHLDWTWKPTDEGAPRKAQRGGMLSGEKLVDNAEFKAQLFAMFPEAIGGEMEGAGLYSAAQRRKREWILIKGICDWGVGKGDKHQELAARNACNLLSALLSSTGLEVEHFGMVTGLIPPPQFVAAEQSLRSVRFMEIQGRIRETHNVLMQKTERHAAFVHESARTYRNGKPVLPRELEPQVKELKAELEVATETWLNAYSDACARYLAHEVDDKLFLDTFAPEIRELVELSGRHTPRLHPRDRSSYATIWATYDELVRLTPPDGAGDPSLAEAAGRPGAVGLPANTGEAEASAEPQEDDDTNLAATVAHWVKTARGFTFAEVGTHIRGKSGLEYKVAVHARRGSLGWWLTLLMALPVGLLLLLAGFYWYGRVTSFWGGAGVFILIVSSMIAAGIVGLARKEKTQHVWVECHDGRGKADRDDIIAFKAKVDDVRARPRRGPEWIPTAWMFVSSSGFSDSALEAAKVHFIECWTKTPEGFEGP